MKILCWQVIYCGVNLINSVDVTMHERHTLFFLVFHQNYIVLKNVCHEGCMCCNCDCGTLCNRYLHENVEKIEFVL